jgi:UDP-N-acetylmuramoyl-L-alanyl-D-glutamate--2,6-diaminopimelate ligase
MLQKIQETATIDSELPGIFNIYNTIASVGAVDMITDNSLQEICDNVTNFGGVSGRCEVVSSNPYIIIDFAHTPDGMKNIFESFNQKDIIVVFGAGGDRDKSKRALMGKIASSYAKKIFITSDNPRFEDPDIIVEDILSGITNKANVVVDINRANAIKKAIDSYEENSVILILGKGDEEYQIIYDKKLPFNDKDIVSKILAS